MNNVHVLMVVATLGLGAACIGHGTGESVDPLRLAADSLQRRGEKTCLQDAGYPPEGKYPFTGCIVSASDGGGYYYEDANQHIVSVVNTTLVQREMVNAMADSILLVMQRQLGAAQRCHTDDEAVPVHVYWSGPVYTTTLLALRPRIGIALSSNIQIQRTMGAHGCSARVSDPGYK
jgi:hypothetical protein